MSLASLGLPEETELLVFHFTKPNTNRSTGRTVVAMAARLCGRSRLREDWSGGRLHSGELGEELTREASGESAGGMRTERQERRGTLLSYTLQRWKLEAHIQHLPP